jgi:hypothetical protein
VCIGSFVMRIEVPVDAKQWAGGAASIRRLALSATTGGRVGFDKTDKRQLAGMPAVRRSRGGCGRPTSPIRWRTPTNRPRKTYNPVNVASGRHRLDQARAKGAVLMEQKPDESVTSPAFVTLLGLMKLAKPLK